MAPLFDALDDICDASFLALAGVPLGHLAKVATNSAIVFHGEKGPTLEQTASLQAKEILEGHLAATRAREAVAVAEAPTPPPRRPRGRVHPDAYPGEVRGRIGLALLNYAVLLALLPLLGPGRTR